MSVLERNKAVVRRYASAFNKGDLKTLRSLFTPDAQIQGVLGTGQMASIEPIWQQLIDGLGMQLDIQEMIAEGDTVAVRFRERGVFRAPFFGHEPTGKPYELLAMEWFQLRDGKICARWAARDQASQARQTGMRLDAA
jgi:predicted ester cyclase